MYCGHQQPQRRSHHLQREPARFHDKLFEELAGGCLRTGKGNGGFALRDLTDAKLPNNTVSIRRRSPAMPWWASALRWNCVGSVGSWEANDAPVAERFR
jgi:hypothetical protein